MVPTNINIQRSIIMTDEVHEGYLENTDDEEVQLMESSAHESLANATKPLPNTAMAAALLNAKKRNKVEEVPSTDSGAIAIPTEPTPAPVEVKEPVVEPKPAYIAPTKPEARPTPTATLKTNQTKGTIL